MSHIIQLKTSIGALSLDVKATFANEIIVVSGENGAGKSTLLRCLAGLQEVAGQIYINQQLWLDSSADFVLPTEKRNLGVVCSEIVLLPWLSVEDNITLGMTKKDQDWLTQLCKKFEIHHLLKRKPLMLSTGEAQRVSLVRAIYRKSTMLLLDEPFSAQAPEVRVRLRNVLQDLQQQLNIPVILVSHDMEDAKCLADQHWRMREGKLLNSIHESRYDKAMNDD